MPVTHSEAYELINSAHRRARELGTQITVAVVDEGGHLQALGRMDGAAPLSAEIATHKAASVALVRRDGAALRQMQEAWPMAPAIASRRYASPPPTWDWPPARSYRELEVAGMVVPRRGGGTRLAAVPRPPGRIRRRRCVVAPRSCVRRAWSVRTMV
jgi:hypothetical protein